MVSEHPEAYSARANMQLTVTPLRDQITAPARTILLVLLAAAGVVFVIACSNVANLILARSVRREGELAVRAALGASHGALRRTLLAESLVLCGAGAVLGVLIAAAARRGRRPLRRALLGARARRRRRRHLFWVGAGLAMAAAVLLAYVPRLPSSDAAAGLGISSGSLRITPGTNRRLRAFATTQIAFSFVLLAGAGMLVAALIALQAANTGFLTAAGAGLRHAPIRSGPGANARSVHAASPRRIGREPCACGPGPDREVTQRVGQLPGVDGVRRQLLRAVARQRPVGRTSSSPSRATRRPTARTIRTRGSETSGPDSSPRSASRCWPAASSPRTTAPARSGSSSSARPSPSGCSPTARRSIATSG